jgi:hypothetical protein
MSALQLCNNVAGPLVTAPGHVIQHHGEASQMDEMATIIGNSRLVKVITPVSIAQKIDKYSRLCQPIGRKG